MLPSASNPAIPETLWFKASSTRNKKSSEYEEGKEGGKQI